MGIVGWIVLILVILAALIALAAWFYERATNEVSLVRTGIGGRKVVIDGGTVAVPFFHEISRVNMQTIRMDVSRTGDRSLITKDRMRVDVGAEFYASVIPEAEAIVRAAQTLGKRTFQPDQLKRADRGDDGRRAALGCRAHDDGRTAREPGRLRAGGGRGLTDTLGALRAGARQRVADRASTRRRSPRSTRTTPSTRWACASSPR
jgi:hypothetical protein